MVTVICDLKRIRHHLCPYIQARLASVVAMFNVVLTLFHRFHLDANPSHTGLRRVIEEPRRGGSGADGRRGCFSLRLT